MTTPIGTVGTPTTTAASSVDRSDQMGKDTFLKLLVAQMRFQDPSNPTSSSEFMAQTATFTQVEKLEEIASQNAELLTLQRSLSAGALVGHQVSYTATDGTTKTGTVSSVKIAGTGAAKTGVVTAVQLASKQSEAVAIIDGVKVQVGRLTEISVTK